MDEIFRQVRWQDVADVAVLTFVLYRLYRWVRGTVAIQVLVGILMLAAAAFAASHLGLLLTAYLLQAAGAVATLVVVVVFRDEIRRGLGRVNPVRWWRERTGAVAVSAPIARLVADAAFALARRRVGALIVVPGVDPLDEHLSGGVTLDAVPSPQLFESIFTTASPIHDGAAVLVAGRMRAAGCFLPVSSAPGLADELGSRHRAACGLTEACDAAVIVVSEERGAVSLVHRGAITTMPDAAALVARLGELETGGSLSAPTPTRRHRRLSRVRDAAALVFILALVVAAWWIIVGQPGTVVTRTVSIELRDVPAELEADPPRPDTVSVHLRGPRTRLDALTATDVQAWIDVGDAQAGRRRYPLEASAPRGIEITEITPPSALVHLRARE